MIYKPWTDSEWLRQEYSVKKKTIHIIARELGEQGISVTAMTIYNWVDKFGLIKNKRDLGKRTIGNNKDGKKKGFYG